MRKLTLTVGLALCLIFSANTTFAQQTTAGQDGTRVITTAVPFLLIAPDSRGGSMGEAGVAVSHDANAMYWNPSAMAFLDNKMGFAMSYSPWLRSLGIPDINLMYLSGYYNTGKGVIGSSLRYFSLGDIQYTSIDGTVIGNEKPSEFAFDMGYALKVSDVLSAAITLRYFSSRLSSAGGVTGDAKPVNSACGDIAFMYKKDFKMRSQGQDIPVQFSSGVNISNIGPKVSYTSATANQDFIPINLRVGYAFKFMLDEYNSLTLTNDFNKLLVPSEGGRSDKPLLDGVFGSFTDAVGKTDENGVPLGTGVFGEEISEINTSIGMEYWYRDLFAARLGYFYEDPAKGDRKFITIGAGIKYNVFGFDFSYLVPFRTGNPLQNTLRFSLNYNFQPYN